MRSQFSVCFLDMLQGAAGLVWVVQQFKKHVSHELCRLDAFAHGVCFGGRCIPHRSLWCKTQAHTTLRILISALTKVESAHVMSIQRFRSTIPRRIFTPRVGHGAARRAISLAPWCRPPWPRWCAANKEMQRQVGPTVSTRRGVAAHQACSQCCSSSAGGIQSGCDPRGRLTCSSASILSDRKPQTSPAQPVWHSTVIPHIAITATKMQCCGDCVHTFPELGTVVLRHDKQVVHMSKDGPKRGLPCSSWNS